MPRPALRRLTDGLPAALLPIAVGVAATAALAAGADPLGTAARLIAALGFTLLLVLPALVLGTMIGALAGASAGLTPRSPAGLFGRALGGAGPLLPGFLLAALTALAVGGGGAKAPLGWAALALPAACQAARLARPAMERALDGGAVRMAQGFGFDERTLLLRHALPAAVAPAMAGFPNAVLAALTGAVVLESLLDLPGAGALMIDAARNGSVRALPIFVALCGLSALLAALGSAARDWADAMERMMPR